MMYHDQMMIRKQRAELALFEASERKNEYERARYIYEYLLAKQISETKGQAVGA